jgi:hypothetical protein
MKKGMAQTGKNGGMTDEVPGLLYRHRSYYLSKHNMYVCECYNKGKPN